MLPPVMTLTPREAEIVKGVAAGTPTRALATALKIAPDTLQGALRIIYLKLKLRGRAQLVRWAFHNGLGDAPARRR